MGAIEDAKAALDRIDQLEAEIETEREKRDAAILRAHTTDGMSAPEVARQLDGRVSESHVRSVRRTAEKISRASRP